MIKKELFRELRHRLNDIESKVDRIEELRSVIGPAAKDLFADLVDPEAMTRYARNLLDSIDRRVSRMVSDLENSRRAP